MGVRADLTEDLNVMCAAEEARACEGLAADDAASLAEAHPGDLRLEKVGVAEVSKDDNLFPSI